VVAAPCLSIVPLFWALHGWPPASNAPAARQPARPSARQRVEADTGCSVVAAAVVVAVVVVTLVTVPVCVTGKGFTCVRTLTPVTATVPVVAAEKPGTCVTAETIAVSSDAEATVDWMELAVAPAAGVIVARTLTEPGESWTATSEALTPDPALSATVCFTAVLTPACSVAFAVSVLWSTLVIVKETSTCSTITVAPVAVEVAVAVEVVVAVALVAVAVAVEVAVAVALVAVDVVIVVVITPMQRSSSRSWQVSLQRSRSGS